MRTLRFMVNGQKMIRDPDCDFDGLVKGSRGYLQIAFSFSSEWAGMAKVAEFRPYRKSEVTSVLLENGSCMVPDNISDLKHWSVNIVGQKGTRRLTTDRCAVRQEG